MLDGPTGVEEGDCVGGAITLQRNPIWRRHMSITIEWSIKRRNETTFTEVTQPRPTELFTHTLYSLVVLFLYVRGKVLSPNSKIHLI